MKKINLKKIVLFNSIFFTISIGISQAQLSSQSADYKIAPNPLKPNYALDSLKTWEKPFSSFAFYVFTKRSHQLPYRLHFPETIKSSEKYPLVLLMHGWGERGLENRTQLKHFGSIQFWEKFPCYVLAPECPKPELKWVDTDFGAPAHSMQEKPTWPLELTMDLLDKIISENEIDINRIYVTGLSMGGFATWELIQREPYKFAAAIPVCGGADTAYASKLAHLPLWVFHGGDDKGVLVERSRTMVKMISKAGGHPKYTEYPGVGHNAWGRTYSNPEVWDWLFAQSKKK